MEKLRNELIKLINESKMGIDCIYYVYKDVFRDLTNEYEKALQKAAQNANTEAEPIFEGINPIKIQLSRIPITINAYHSVIFQIRILLTDNSLVVSATIIPITPTIKIARGIQLSLLIDKS